MKIYSMSEELMEQIPEIDFKGSWQEYNARVEEHQKLVEEWLRDVGYDGPNTGEIYQSQIADGYARYMIAEGPRTFLIHVCYDDGYHDPDVEFIPKKEILKRISARKEVAKLFGG